MSYNYVRPQGQRQAKIWNYYNNSDTWDWYRISKIGNVRYNGPSDTALTDKAIIVTGKQIGRAHV